MIRLLCFDADRFHRKINFQTDSWRNILWKPEQDYSRRYPAKAISWYVRHRILRSACAHAQADQSLWWLLYG